MEFPVDGVEYAQITFDDYPTGVTAVQASLDRQTWFALDVQPALQPDGTWLGKVLLRGPNAQSTDGHVVADGQYLWVRVVDSPEILPVRAGQLYLI